MTYIIQVGSHQFLAQSGDLVPVQKLNIEDGQEIEVKVLASFANGKANIKPSTVKAKVVSQFRDDKIRVVKYRSKSKYHKQYGHCQDMTLLEIL